MTPIQTLTEHWLTARTGSGRLVPIVGVSGSGKSALVTRFLDTLEEPVDGGLVVRASCAEQSRVMETLVLRVADGLRAVAGAPSSGVPRVLPGAAVAQAVRDLSALPAVRDVPPLDSARIHAELLLDVVREYAVLIALDDVHRADPESRRLLAYVAAALQERPGHRLLIVCTASPALDGADPWLPQPAEPMPMPPADEGLLTHMITTRLARWGTPAPAYVQRVLAAAQGNPRAVEALVHLTEPAALAQTPEGLDDPQLAERPGFAGIGVLATGRLPDVPVGLRADLETAAIAGVRFDPTLLAQVWRVPPDAAAARVQRLAETGIVGREDGEWRFWSSAAATHFADAVTPDRRHAIHGQIAAVLRAQSRLAAGSGVRRIDVTETWSEQRRRDRRFDRSLDHLADAADHFAAGGRHAEAAEAATALAEYLTDSLAARPPTAARYGRRVDRERRHRIYAALDQAEAQLEAARRAAPEFRADAETLSITVRLYCARARFKESLGDLAAARDAAATAVELAEHVAESKLRLEAQRVELAVAFAAGDNNAARRILVRVLDALDAAPAETAARGYEWVGQAMARWEWIGLHDRVFPTLIERLHAAGAHLAALRVRVERMAAAIEADDAVAAEALLVEAIDDATDHRLVADIAELLALNAADLVQGVVDAHYDSLSGEFFPPDVYEGAAAPSLSSRLALPVDLLSRAEVLADHGGRRVSLLRVLSVALGCIYDTRERLAELTTRWRNAPELLEGGPLAEVAGMLDQGFFEVEHAESISTRAVALARELGLDQILADTLYEGLDRDLPGLRRQLDTACTEAMAAYQRVGDVYGQITLSLVRSRHLERRKLPVTECLERVRELLDAAGDELSAEQRAFVHLRLGEYVMQARDHARAAYHLEQALRGYDEAGDVGRVHEVGEALREVYRELGDLSRYRVMRDRARALELRVPGADPLGLELRIEHLLSLARQEQNEERAIEMAERCVQLFGRMPDGTPRIDECFVEISKICRRRADEAQSDAGMDMWLRRSLEAVHTAAAINRELGNFHRVFEEYHELFDDLIGLGAYEDYLRARAESRELAFAVGHVGELMYLFDEHLQPGPGGGFEGTQMTELRSFYEALLRYLLALGARAAAVSLQRTMIDFLMDLGDEALAEHYGSDRMMT